MSTVDEIQKLCEQFISRKFGKRDKAALLEFLRGLQGQRQGDSDEEESPKPRYTPAPRREPLHTQDKVEEEAPSLLGVKEGTLLHKKASQYQQNVTTKQVGERSQPVRVSDIDDVEGVKERKEKWVNEIASPERATSFRKTDANEAGYKVSDAEDVRKRREEWETGKVTQGDMKKGGVEELGYKVNDADAVRKRREEWESGKVAHSQNKVAGGGVEDLGYKVSDAEDVRKRRAEWESGKVAQSDFKKSHAEELGYKVSDADDVKQRRAEWESGKVAQSQSQGKVASEPSDAIVDPEEVKKRREEWEAGKVAGSQSKNKVASDANDAVVDPEEVKKRREEWESGKSHSEKPTGERKAPIQLPEREITVDDQTDVRVQDNDE